MKYFRQKYEIYDSVTYIQKIRITKFNISPLTC